MSDPPRVVQDAAELGMMVLVWTVNDPHFARRLKESGVTGVITDDPAAIRVGITPE